MKTKIALAFVSATLLLSACSKSEETPAATEATTAEAAPAVAAAGTTGVPECDTFYAKIESCLKDKIPEAQRGPMDAAFKQSKEQMLKIGDKAAMAKACTDASAQAKAAYGAMGCTL